MELQNLEQKYLERLAELYPTIARASTEIINYQAILNLPKGTEHFITDIHGEYEAFSHVLRNGSGSVKKKIDDVFGRTLSIADKNALATLIYYPQEKMNLVKKNESNMEDWYRVMLYQLIEICKRVASKYTRSKVRKALPKDFSYVIEELITEKAEILDKEFYYNTIVDTIIDTGRAEPFIVALCELIQRLVIDHLHILGDIYDRGPGAVRIMDTLTNYHSLDIQWGNHDIVWMGAAVGSPACIATVLRNSIRYSNLDTLEDGYGINLLPLAMFAMDVYRDDPCEIFQVKKSHDYTPNEYDLMRRMYKAITVIEFKLEGQLIKKYPFFEMEDRLFLDQIDYARGTVRVYGKEYPLRDSHFPTILPEDPYQLSNSEQLVVDRLIAAFTQCEKLQQHTKFLLNKGSLYKVFNNNLLYHGCLPLDENGEFMEVDLFGTRYRGRKLYDALESYVRKAFFARDPGEAEKGRDILWYLWSSPKSPLFGKDKMATFERILIENPETHKEHKNPYYRLLDNEKVMNHVLREFGLGEDAHIVNGHVPVLQGSGESPVKCGGKVLIIDGGFSRAYQPITGIAGYTLIYNSYGMMLVAHEPLTSAEEAITKGTDIHSDRISVMMAPKRLKVADTDNGKAIQERIQELKELLNAYQSGTIIERP